MLLKLLLHIFLLAFRNKSYLHLFAGKYAVLSEADDLRNSDEAAALRNSCS